MRVRAISSSQRENHDDTQEDFPLGPRAVLLVGGASAPHRQRAFRLRSIRAERYDPDRDGVAYRPPGSLSSIVSGFKGAVTRRVRDECDIAPDATIWHRNFHDHVLRDERSWRAVRRYIRLNPQRWWQKHGRPSRTET